MKEAIERLKIKYNGQEPQFGFTRRLDETFFALKIGEEVVFTSVGNKKKIMAEFINFSHQS